MSELVAVFLVGLFGSAHCAGMCGGFAATIGASTQPASRSIVRQLVYGLGRIATYAFLGAIAGFAGLYLSQYDTALASVQQMFSVLAGGVMALIGLFILGIPRPTALLRLGGLGTFVVPAFSQLLNTRGWAATFVAGLATGFLPCGLVYALLAKAIATGSMLRGVLLMAAFGMGTVPAMTAIGCGGTLLGHAARARAYRIAACILIVFGIVTIRRGVPSSDAHHHHHHPTAMLETAAV